MQVLICVFTTLLCRPNLSAHIYIILPFVAGALLVQRFEQQPAYTEVNPGQDALLACKVLNKRGSCSWQKDNKVQLRARSLLITAIQKKDCVIIGMNGHNIQQETLLLMGSAKEITYCYRTRRVPFVWLLQDLDRNGTKGKCFCVPLSSWNFCSSLLSLIRNYICKCLSDSKVIIIHLGQSFIMSDILINNINTYFVLH